MLLIALAHENAFNFLMNWSYILSFYTWCCFIYASKELYWWTLCNATVWMSHRNVSLQHFCPHYGLIVVLRRKCHSSAYSKQMESIFIFNVPLIKINWIFPTAKTVFHRNKIVFSIFARFQFYYDKVWTAMQYKVALWLILLAYYDDN